MPSPTTEGVTARTLDPGGSPASRSPCPPSGALFVEGPHDQILLGERFGDQLRAAGIHVFPVRGADNLPGLITAGIMPAPGIRLAAIIDGTSVARARAGTPQTRGEIAVARLLSEAAQAGVHVHAVGLGKPDILFYLDEETCQQVAPGFPGWEAAIGNWRDSGSHAPWKEMGQGRLPPPAHPRRHPCPSSRMQEP
jgi:hypothetical protein